jgi:ABC-type transporter Mla MlaB component
VATRTEKEGDPMEKLEPHPFAPALRVHLALREAAALLVVEGSLVRRAAPALVNLVDSLSRQADIRRISIDASCVTDIDDAGNEALAVLRARRPQGVVVGPVGATTVGPLVTRLQRAISRLAHLRPVPGPPVAHGC